MHVIVGMSGGVDSSVTALLLKQKGYKVSGIFMQNWEDDDEHCTARQDYRDASSVATKLGIELTTVNFADEYWERVFAHFLTEYGAGRTPNPDILCNKEIKFKAFLDHAYSQGADAIATGHYVRSTADFHLYSKKDSTGICFIGERKFSAFLAEYLPAQPGKIVTDAGDTIGQHNGLMFYTLGQRQGLGIGGLRESSESPWYVLAKNVSDNLLVVGQGHDHPMLLRSSLNAHDTHWVNKLPPATTFRCSAKVRYRQQDQPATVEIRENNTLHITFDNPVRAATPGQSLVLYDEERCIQLFS